MIVPLKSKSEPYSIKLSNCADEETTNLNIIDKEITYFFVVSVFIHFFSFSFTTRNITNVNTAEVITTDPVGQSTTDP